MNVDPVQLAADKAALERHLPDVDCDSEYSWGFWDPPSCVGLHISLGKHANSLHVDRRVRFQIKKILHFQTRKLGSPLKSDWSMKSIVKAMSPIFRLLFSARVLLRSHPSDSREIP